MIIGRGETLWAVLSGAVAANQPDCHVEYTDIGDDRTEKKQPGYRTAMNGTTGVEILSAPLMVGAREVSGLTIHNNDTANVTVTVKTVVASEYIRVKHTLLPGETLGYTREMGWYVL